MKIAACIRLFFSIALAASCLMLPVLAGCAGPAARPVIAAPTQPDGYPNLNLPVHAAAPQITEEERAALTQDLSAKRRQVEGGSAAVTAEAERLRRLGREQTEETLRRIEAGQ